MAPTATTVLQQTKPGDWVACTMVGPICVMCREQFQLADSLVILDSRNTIGYIATKNNELFQKDHPLTEQISAIQKGRRRII